MTILSVSDIRLEYGTDIILQKINFSINEGDRLGIVGVNGAGKSTLLRIIAGTTEPSGGNVFIAKGKTVGMLEQNAHGGNGKRFFRMSTHRKTLIRPAKRNRIESQCTA